MFAKFEEESVTYSAIVEVENFSSYGSALSRIRKSPNKTDYKIGGSIIFQMFSWEAALVLGSGESWEASLVWLWVSCHEVS